MRLILDANVLISRPDLLARGDASLKFLLPQPAYQQLRNGRFGPRIVDLVERASGAGRLKVLPAPSEIASAALVTNRINQIDAQILAAALEYRNTHSGIDVYFVSDDRALVAEARRHGLKTAASKTVDALVKSSPFGMVVSEELSDAANAVKRSERNYLVGGFVLGLAVAGVLFAAWYLQGYLLDTFPVWGITLGAAAGGTTMFWVLPAFQWQGSCGLRSSLPQKKRMRVR
jgi:hypothetical protein